MPREHFGADYQYLPKSSVLSFEEISRLVRIFATLGAEKLRLTGGEPLLRRDVHKLVGLLRASSTMELAMTSNGSLLEKQAEALATAGLDRITISLDSTHDATFQAMNDVDFSVDRVIAGIDAAQAAGLDPIKINAVVRRNVNEASVLDLASFGRQRGHTVRFIEYMDVGYTNSWKLGDIVPASEILDRIHARFPIEALHPRYRGEVARRYRYLDGGGEVGVIASVTAPFCGDCSRARLSADGHLYTCLFASEGLDLRAPLRRGESDEELARRIEERWVGRTDRYSEQRAVQRNNLPPVEMSYIGG